MLLFSFLNIWKQFTSGCQLPWCSLSALSSAAVSPQRTPVGWQGFHCQHPSAYLTTTVIYMLCFTKISCSLMNPIPPVVPFLKPLNSPTQLASSSLPKIFLHSPPLVNNLPLSFLLISTIGLSSWGFVHSPSVLHNISHICCSLHLHWRWREINLWAWLPIPIL